MTRAELTAALERKSREADHASDILSDLVDRFNFLSSRASERMREMTLSTRQGRTKDEHQ